MQIIDKLIATATREIGTKERPANSNNVKYNTAYYGQEVYDGLWGTEFPWCCVFIWWLFKECAASSLFYGGNKTASCTTLMNYYKSKGQFFKTPRVGSLAFFQFNKDPAAEHIGIVTVVGENGAITTIEGNTGTGNDTNGGEVMKRSRRVSQCLGFAYPYEEEDDMTKDEVIKIIQEYEAAKSEKAVSSWAANAWRKAKDKGIMDGTAPVSNPTREQIAVILDRLGLLK